MRLIGIVADAGIGGTFLNWSLHYLSGCDDYFLSKNSVHGSQSKIESVIQNPLTGSNSHKFLPNQPTTLQQTKDIIEELQATPTNSFHSIYLHCLTNSYRDIQDTKQAFSAVAEACDKIVLLTLPPEHVCYYISKTNRAGISPNFSGNGAPVTENLFEYYQDFFYPEFKNYKYNTLGELREIYALTYSFFYFDQVKDLIDDVNEYFLLNSVDLWTSFDCTIEKLFTYLELDISKDRYKNWTNIYSHWQKIHQPNFTFSLYFNSIIEHILKGRYLDLTRFNLDIFQEAAIQHYLIQNHNLNLKCYQLDKFIDTKQLHNLLEPNTHPSRLHKSVIR